MARESVNFRDNLALLKEAYPGKLSLTIQEACAVLNLDRRTLLKDKSFPAKMSGGKYFVPIVNLARYMS